MFRLAAAREANVALGLHVGGLDVGQIEREIDRAYRMGDVRPGMDSLIVFDRDFDPGDVTVTALMELALRVLRHEGGVAVRFHSVLYPEGRAGRMFAEVFAATWRSFGPLASSHTVVESLAEGEALLGIRNAGPQIAALRTPLGVAYLG